MKDLYDVLKEDEKSGGNSNFYNLLGNVKIKADQNIRNDIRYVDSNFNKEDQLN